MLTRICFENFRSFKEGDIHLKPITVFVGKNNVGKSAILSILSIIKQTSVQYGESNFGPLKINGRHANAGEPESLFYYGDTKKQIKIELFFRYDNMRLRLESELSDIQNRLAILASTLFELERNTPGDRPTIADRLRSREDFDESNMRELINRVRTIVPSTQTLRRLERLLGIAFPARETKTASYSKHYDSLIADIETAFNFASSMLESLEVHEKANSDRVSEAKISFGLGLSDEKLIFRRLQFSLQGQTVAECVFKEDGEVAGVHSDFVDSKDRTFEKFAHDLFSSRDSLFDCVRLPRGRSYSTASIVGNLCQSVLNTLKRSVSGNTLVRVPPLRTKPKRYYLSDDVQDERSQHSVVLNTLISQDTKVLESMNRWFSIFGVNLKPENRKDVYYRILSTKEGDELELDITDLGFGVSQVLPVVVLSFLLRSGSTLVIEQPEIHLHPAMQSALVDLFDEVTRGTAPDEPGNGVDGQIPIMRDKMIIIESHSEYILNKLANSHVKFDRGDLNGCSISSSDVSVNYVARVDSGERSYSYIEPISSAITGSYVIPDPFFDAEVQMMIDTLS